MDKNARQIPRRAVNKGMLAALVAAACGPGPGPSPDPPSGGGGTPPTPSEPIFSGFCYSPFRDGQDPDYGIFPTESQIRADLGLVYPLSHSIRTYGNNSILFEIPRLCEEKGIDCYPGAWIFNNLTENANAINRAILHGNAGRATTKGLVIGNEVLLRGDVPKSTLISYITNTKSATDTPVGTAETWSVWLNNPDLAAASDFIFAHVHPYWDNVDAGVAAQYVVDRYHQLEAAYPGKPIFIGETGWPTGGAANGVAVPNVANQEQFWGDFIPLARNHTVNWFGFEAFDELWKAKYGAVEGTWGLFYSNRTKKLSLVNLEARF